jgi:Fe-S-cluster containining protein
VSETRSTNNGSGQELCLACGLCCNGVIFADVKLQEGDNAARLQSFGLPVSVPDRVACTPFFNQPCAALDGCRCRIYPHRPKYCREFSCLLLGQLKEGRIEMAAALRIVRSTRDRAEKVRGLLRLLGETDEKTPLSRRFRRTASRLQKAKLDEKSSHMFGELTLAVHDLNLQLRQAFYR